MQTYSTMTLDDLIEALRELGNVPVRGMGFEIDSYRGYYERNAVEPSPDVEVSASDLADEYEKQIGKQIIGYKGGYYEVRGSENVYLAAYGCTGLNICGLIATSGGWLEPVLVEVSEW